MSQSLSSRLHDMEWRPLDEIAQEIIDAVGDLSGFEVFGSQVLIGVYCRAAITKAGFRLGAQLQLEDVWQGKVGLILKIGPTALRAGHEVLAPEEQQADGPPARRWVPGDEERFNGRLPQLGDWVFSRAQDCEQINYKGLGSKKARVKAPNGEMEDARGWQGWPCRLLYARDIYGRVALPNVIV